MHELFMRTRFRREDDVLLHQMDLRVEFVDHDPVAQIPVQPIGLLDHHQQSARLFPGEVHHLAECCATGSLGRFNINEILG